MSILSSTLGGGLCHEALEAFAKVKATGEEGIQARKETVGLPVVDPARQIVRLVEALAKKDS